MSVLAAAALLVAMAAPVSAIPNEVPGTVNTYTFNINKMSDNWAGWAEWVMDFSGTFPDVILVQDLEDDGARNRLETKLEEYASPLAVNYESRGGTSRNGDYQMGVLWRADRFRLVRSQIFDVYGYDDVAGCQVGVTNASAINVVLEDLRTPNSSGTGNKTISAVSYKTKPKPQDFCAFLNTGLVKSKLVNSFNGDLEVLGTDANAWDRQSPQLWKCWYMGSVAGLGSCNGSNHGYYDPILKSCGSINSPCLDAHWTSGTNRIDYLFGMLGNGTQPTSVNEFTLPLGKDALGVPCVTSPPTGCTNKWSNHRSVRATFIY